MWWLIYLKISDKYDVEFKRSKILTQASLHRTSDPDIIDRKSVV